MSVVEPTHEELSALEELAGMAVRMVLLAARVRGAAMLCLARLAMAEYATLEGQANASQWHARQARLCHENSLNLLRRGIKQ